MASKGRKFVFGSINLTARVARVLTNPQLHRVARAIVPMLLACALSSIAHAQGTMDFSGAQTLMGTFKTVDLGLRASYNGVDPDQRHFVSLNWNESGPRRALQRAFPR